MSFYTSLTGLIASTTELAITSNNIANAGTSGFKKSSADFGDIFASSPLQKASSVVGAGVSLKQVAQEFTQGNIEFSANSLDLAVTGDGFFALQTPDGTSIYTRNGGFLLNEQNQMVNAAGQSLMSLPVDSTNKADFSKPLTALTIPRRTVAEFKATTSVELGLNLPSDSIPITATFNKNNPETFHKTNSFTVYGASGSSHLTTIYYTKTATATAEDPFNKWQTHVYIDGELVDPELIQAADTTSDPLFVNKFGELKTLSELVTLQRTSSDSEKYLITTGTLYKKYSYDDLSRPIVSTPATVEAEVPVTSLYVDNLNLTNNQSGVDFSTFTRTQLSDMFNVSVDGSGLLNVGLEHLAGKDVELSGTQIAFELTNQINTRFSDNKAFELASAGNITLRRVFATDDVDATTVDSEGVSSSTFAPKELVISLSTILGRYVFEADEVRTAVTAEEITYALGKHIASLGVTYNDDGTAVADAANPATSSFTDLSIEYDASNQGFRFSQSSSSDLYLSNTDDATDPIFGVSQAAVTLGDVSTFGDVLSPLDSDQDVLLLPEILPNGDLLTSARDQRTGILVTYSDGKFQIRSGTTGDSSSLSVTLNFDDTASDSTTLTASSTLASELLGMTGEGLSVLAQASQINNVPTRRGQISNPAIVTGKAMGVDPRNPFSVNETNWNLTVIIDGISSQIRLDAGQYSIGTFTAHLQEKINLMADSLGRSVSGVKVDFDDSKGALVITGATNTDTSFIQIAGHPDWGLDDIDAVFGETSTYITLEQATDGTGGMYVFQDKSGKWIETSDKSDFDDNNIPYWTPIFLDQGELTFDTSGTLISPLGTSRLESRDITGTTVSLEYGRSTQYNSPFAVLNQTQNGAPEGNLVGVNIGDDGLVVASYSNGSQKSLGKIILANFATAQGLRQIGDSSFYATSASGEATYGEAGAAGFGTLRAGARERSNVDLTGELVDLITAQRNFQANAKAIETTNAMTQAIINIRG